MARQVGLKDIHIAILTKDDAAGTTYSVPEKLEKSVKVTIKPKTSSDKTYADDAVDEVLNTIDSIDVEIELNQLSLESRAKLQGAKLEKGLLTENKDDIAPELALGFKSKKSNKKYRYVWLLKGKFELADDDYETEEEKPKGQSAKLKGTFYPRLSDGSWRTILDEDAKEADATLISNWFKQVIDKVTITPK